MRFTEERRHGCVAEVTVHDQDLLVFDGKGNTEVNGGKALTGTRVVGSDSNNLVVSAGHELQVGTENTEGLVDDVTVARLDNDRIVFLFLLSD